MRRSLRNTGFEVKWNAYAKFNINVPFDFKPRHRPGCDLDEVRVGVTEFFGVPAYIPRSGVSEDNLDMIEREAMELLDLV